MRNLLKWLIHSLRNDGLQSVVFRILYSLSCRSGLMVIRFLPSPQLLRSDIHKEFRNTSSPLFFDFTDVPIPPIHNEFLSLKIKKLRQGEFLYFNKTWYSTTDWHTHPVTGIVFEKHLHWSKIKDISEKGDIKFIWEKSRFMFVYDYIRYQHYSGESTAEEVFRLIENWIQENPVNTGPNWLCSQEISIRVLNWIFVLYYYRHAAQLTDLRLQLILQSIYDQMTHVWKNRHFALHLVKNNHVLSESLALYLTGLLFPYLPDSRKWLKTGRITFDNEICRQIFDDGTYLQYSMNYHRMVVQMLSWYLQLSNLNVQEVNETVKNKAIKSVHFLRHCMDEETGELPNYGHNDGTLLFPLTDCDYSDFRPSILALSAIVNVPSDLKNGVWDEETAWLTGQLTERKPESKVAYSEGFTIFPDSGYYLMRDSRSLTFIKCGRYQHRPAQADNLHIDLWVDGENIMLDAGSYSYNTDPELRQYYMGTASHNTIMLNGIDQMGKGLRFLWYKWIENASGSCFLNGDKYVFDGRFEGFRHIRKGIIHIRKVAKSLNKIEWEITDYISGGPVNTTYQLIWHPMSGFFDKFSLEVFTKEGKLLIPEFFEAGVSRYYGHQDIGIAIRFSSDDPNFRSIIRERKN
jgi:hypothetical protein